MPAHAQIPPNPWPGRLTPAVWGETVDAGTRADPPKPVARPPDTRLWGRPSIPAHAQIPPNPWPGRLILSVGGIGG